MIPARHLGRWIEPWYVAYAILGALASGSAVILIPLAVFSRGGSVTQTGAAIAAQNVGALFAPFWGWASDRFKDYRPIFFGGFLLIGAGFVSFALIKPSSSLLLQSHETTTAQGWFAIASILHVTVRYLNYC